MIVRVDVVMNRTVVVVFVVVVRDRRFDNLCLVKTLVIDLIGQ